MKRYFNQSEIKSKSVSVTLCHMEYSITRTSLRLKTFFREFLDCLHIIIRLLTYNVMNRLYSYETSYTL